MKSINVQSAIVQLNGGFRYGNKEKLQGKTANYKVLRDTNMPAILLEWLFMDTEEDCQILLSKEGKERIADATVAAIKRMLS